MSNVFSSILYADDNTLILKHTSFDSFVNNCNQEIFKLKNWTLASKLSPYLDKTYAMVFTFRDTTVMEPQSFIDDKLLEFKGTGVFLGVTVNDKL